MRQNPILRSNILIKIILSETQYKQMLKLALQQTAKFIQEISTALDGLCFDALML